MRDSDKFDKIHEECGIFGGMSHSGDIAPYIKCGLLKLQHRGQESAGICAGDRVQEAYKGSGLVNQALLDEKISALKGSFGIGHVRYSTCGDNRKENIQPLKIQYLGEDVSLAHNGNVEQAAKIREKFERIGEVFLSSSDSEVMLKRIVFSMKKPPSKWDFYEVGKCLKENFSKGAYCTALFLPERILAYRDPAGFRPLVFARTREGNFIASEDVAFCGLNIDEIIEIKAGEGIEITREGFEIKRFADMGVEKRCVFEQIYFANSASNVFSQSVYQTRVQLGELLASYEDSDFCADVVIPVMDSGLACAIGYHQASGVPFHLGLVRNIWMGRSFILPETNSRNSVVKQKFIPVKSVIEGKDVVVVDDSLVRGSTSSQIVKILKKAGANKVHMRSVSPKIINTCAFGVDIPTKEELIAHNKNDCEIASQIGADTVRFLPLEALDKVFKNNCWCRRCFIDEL